jgi:fermentation-respiration switch protein FrsA (DUF1100 family)
VRVFVILSLAMAFGRFALARAMIYPGCAVPIEAEPGVEVIDYKANDGTPLRGGWVRSGRKNTTAVLWFHGNAESCGTNVWIARELSRAGLDVFLAEYRGYGGLGGSPTEDGLVSDATGALDVVRAKAPEECIVIAGQSLGTGVAVTLASRNKIRGLILVSPYTSLVDMGRGIAGPLAPLLVPDRFDSIGEVPKLDLPIVVIHGTADEVVPFEHGRKIAAAAKRAKLVPVEGASHNAIPGLPGLVAAAVADVTSR